MTTIHERAGAYLDGTLAPDLEAAFLDHLVDCAACQAALEDDVQLRDREDELRARAVVGEAAPQTSVPPASASVPRAGASVPRAGASVPRAGATVTPIGGRRRAAIAIGVVGGLAAAAAVMWFVRRDPPIAPPQLALAATRAIEPRLSHPAFAGYRPYDVPRGATAVHERIAPDVIAAFDRAHDCRGVASAYVLSGELVRASDSLAGCGDAPEVLADRAGVAVLTGHPDDALDLADRALAAQPDLGVALWNRALAERDLGLGLIAAEDLDRVAALEPAWAAEARRRSAALRAELTALRDSWQRVVEVGAAMVAGGPVIPAALARQHPGRARVFLGEAIQTARTRARLDQLRPLAAALEGLAGDDLARAIDGVTLTSARLALVDEFAAMIAQQAAPDGAKFAAWSARARAAGALDLIVVATYVTSRVGDDPAAALRDADALHDPWLALATLADAAAAARTAGRTDVAAALLDDGAAQCPRGAPAYRCLTLTLERASLELARYHPAPAYAQARAGLRDAVGLGEWPQRQQALFRLGEAERFRSNFARARAYYRELGAADGSCATQVNAAVLQGDILFDEHRLAEARAVALTRPACALDDLRVELMLEADLLHAGAPVRAPEATIAAIAAAEAALPADDREARIFYDYLRARAELGRAPDAVARLRAIAVAGRGGADGSLTVRAARGAETAAIVDAGRRQAWREVVAIAAEVRGLAPPPACALVIGADDFEQVGVAVGPAGEMVGQFAPDQVRPTDWLAPAPLRARLRGCAQVDVLAEPPWLGVAPLLDPDMPWRYVMGPARAVAPGAARRVVIADPRPPASLGLPALAPWSGAVDASTEVITGAAATPARLASAARTATILEIHAHAERVADSDAPALALSDSAAGWALTAEAARLLRLERAPIVILADCVGAVPARYVHTSWGLPSAFLDAGARGVVGALAPIPDADAAVFFAEVITDLQRGAALAVAVARARASRVAADPTSWARHVVVFE